MVKITAFVVYLMMRFLWVSARKKYHYLTPIEESQSMGVCWHSELLMSTQMYRKIRPRHSTSAIISLHKDGELVARIMSYFSIKPLRGSSRKGAHRVLLQAMRVLEQGEEVLVTPDGPRGPRYQMSDGILSLAMKSDLPIVIINYLPSSYWQLKSWDRFLIPKPFARIDFYIQSVSIGGMERDEAREFLRLKMIENALP